MDTENQKRRGDSPDNRQEDHGPNPALWRKDQSLVADALAGCSTAMNALLQRLELVPPILDAMNQRNGRALQHHDLTDLKQDTLLVVWKKLPTFDARAKLSTWMYQICHFEFMNHARRVHAWSKRKNASSDELLKTMASPEPDRGSCLDLELHLEKLSEEDAEVLRFKHYEGLELQEIANRLGVSLSKAKRLYYGARERLLARLAGEERNVAS